MALDRVALNLNANGKPIDYIDEHAWGLPLEKIYSQNMHRVFCVVQVPRTWLPKLQEWMTPVGYSKILGPMGEPLPDPLAYRDRAVVCDLAEVGRAVGIPDLQAKVQSTTDVVPLVNGLELSMDLFKDARLFSPDGKIVDLNTIASGSYTVGAAMDYATWALFCADIAATLTGALTGTQMTAVTETAATNLVKTQNQFTFTITSAINSKGNYGAGYLISVNVSSDTVVNFLGLQLTSTSPCKIDISNLNIKHIGTPATYGMLLQINNQSVNVVTTIKDCLFDANGKKALCIHANGYATVYFEIFNCVFANGASGAAGYSIGLDLAAPVSTNGIIDNCTAYNFTGPNGIGFLNYNNSAYVAKNLACFGNTKDYAYSSFLAGLGATTASKCASSDTTGSEAGLRSLVAANQFQSLTLADGDPFLKLKTGSALAGAGVAPSIAANIYGIRGNTRPHSGLYSIGADEYNVAPYAHILARRRGM